MMMLKMIGFSSSSSSKIILEDSHFRFGTESFSRKTFQLKFLRLDSVQNRVLKPIQIRSSSIEVSQVNIEASEMELVENASVKTVRVRFQMQKECVFGEHFYILGDDSVFGGLWDPETALPMNWSDGHVWTIDLDLPVGRLVEFKFILKAKTGEFLWQPGPNRSIETWESHKMIRVCEDWENADLQMMIEEDFVPVGQELKQSVTDVSLSGVEEEDEVIGNVQQNTGYVSDESEETSNGALTAREANVTKEAMFSEEEEGPVLVPGLFSLSDLENEEVSGPSDNVTGEVINEGKAKTFPEVDRKQETREERNEKGKVRAISVFENLEQKEVKSVEQRQYNNVAEEEETEQERLEIVPFGRPNVVLEKDIQWGRRMLNKLLSSFGLF